MCQDTDDSILENDSSPVKISVWGGDCYVNLMNIPSSWGRQRARSHMFGLPALPYN